MYFKYLLALLCCVYISRAAAGEEVRQVLRIKLPDSLSAGVREFSGLAVDGDRMYFLSENRADHFKTLTRGIYSVLLSELDQCIADTSRGVENYFFHPLSGIDRAAERIEGYQGLEALVIRGDRFFVTVETDKSADSSYLLTGRRRRDVFEIDTAVVIALKKPALSNGENVFNAGFEALAAVGDDLYAIFEYNGFRRNFAYRINPGSLAAEPVLLNRRIPFRVTDAVRTEGRFILGINYFFPLKAEAIYQEGLSRKEKRMIADGRGGMRPVARLFLMEVKRRKLKRKRYIALPEQYWTSNWEGIARHRDGVFLVNDKFIAKGGRETQLIYINLTSRE